MKYRKNQLKLPKAPPGPPPELPSEKRAKLAPLTNDRPNKCEDTGGEPIAQPGPPESPLKAKYPFVPDEQLMSSSDVELFALNCQHKAMMWYDDRDGYRAIIRKYGSHHRVYKDKEDYGNQKEDKGIGKRPVKGRSKKGGGGTFYNSV